MKQLLNELHKCIFEAKKTGDKNLKEFVFEYYTLFLSTFVFGLASHGYMLANKIPFGGDVETLFDKGATTVSGRWGLELINWLLPDVSMPWFNGLFSLLMVALTVCIIVELLGIKSKVLQILVGGLVICCPAQTATLFYMFTTAPYAFAMMLAVLSVYEFERGGKARWIISPLMLIYSCSLYQTYFAFATSISVIILIKELIENKKTVLEVFAHAITLFLLLVVSVGIYGITVVVASKITAIPTLDVINREQSLLLRIAVAYSAYIKTIIKGYFAYVNTKLQMLFHLALLAFAAIFVIRYAITVKDKKKIGLLFFLLFIFPLSCYCVYMLSDNGYIHSLALYPFCSLYVLLAVLFDRLMPEGEDAKRIAVLALLGAVIYSNVSFNNRMYFLAQMQFESELNFYTSLMAVLTETEGFDGDKTIALVGDAPEAEYDISRHFDADTFMTPSFNIKHNVHASGFINNYLGYDIPIAEDEELSKLAEMDEVIGMSTYPYYGSVKIVDNYIVVKLK